MDSEVQRDGRVLDLTDDAWREDRLPYEDVTIPLISTLQINTEDVRTLKELVWNYVVNKKTVQSRHQRSFKESKSELPEAEQDNGGSTESVKEQEMKWSDLALQSLHENTPSSGT